MCGICGTLMNDSAEAQRATDLMISNLDHRGPDAHDQISFPDNRLTLGHTRLSIIDLASSSQPMRSQCGRYTIVFNGEVFNYQQLRENLDYPFETDGDTETLLALWVEEQESCLPKLRGQFAFAIWDNELSRLSFAVDRFGILPLYVYQNGKDLAFSSAICALRAAFPDIVPDPQVVPDLLWWRTVPAPQTTFTDVTRVAPGEVWHLHDGTFTRSSWVPQLESTPKLSKPAKVSELHRLLLQSADRSITADVEVGVFLSGGIDSALVAALAQQRLPYQMHAYTATWPGAPLESEAFRATHAASLLDLNQTLIEVGPDEWWSALLESAPFRAAPHGEPADAIVYLLAKRASQNVKVVLTGEGADELFGGYPKNRVEFLRKVPFIGSLSSLALSRSKHRSDEKISRVLHALATKDAASRWATYFSTDWSSTVPELQNPVTEFHSKSGGLTGLRDYDIRNYLPSVLLDRADSMAMAHSLEVRPIFLDSDVVDFAYTLSDFDLVDRTMTKPLLRTVAQQILPIELVSVPKRGFPLPLNEWLRTNLYEQVEHVLNQPSDLLDSYISRENRMTILREHRLGTQQHGLRLFTLLSLLLWEASGTSEMPNLAQH